MIVYLQLGVNLKMNQIFLIENLVVQLWTWPMWHLEGMMVIFKII